MDPLKYRVPSTAINKWVWLYPPPPPPPPPPGYLEVVGKLLPASVARVHGDEDGTGGVNGNLCALKDKSLQVLVDCHLDGLDLLGDH